MDILIVIGALAVLISLISSVIVYRNRTRVVILSGPGKEVSSSNDKPLTVDSDFATDSKIIVSNSIKIERDHNRKLSDAEMETIGDDIRRISGPKIITPGRDAPDGNTTSQMGG
jgi:hypothetical protein